MSRILRAALGLTLAFTSLTAAQNTNIPLICHDNGVQIIGVVGTNVTNGTQSYGLTLSFIQHVMAALPQSSNISLNYNRFPPGAENGPEFIMEVNEGIPALQAALQNYTAACPKTPVVLHGYSEGAVVIGNLLCGASSGSFPPTNPLKASYLDQIIAIITYGDETRTANQSYNQGSCTANAPHLPRRNPQGCAPYASRMKAYCFANDIDCCGTANASAPWPYGINPHRLYPAAFDSTATNFVVSQYYAYKNATNGTTSSSSLSKTVTATVKSTLTTTSKTSSKVTTTKAVYTPSTLSHYPFCTDDRCLDFFAAHPATASNFCHALYSGKATATPFPGVCASTLGSPYQSRVLSACGCLVFPVATTLPVSI